MTILASRAHSDGVLALVDTLDMSNYSAPSRYQVVTIKLDAFGMAMIHAETEHETIRDALLAFVPYV